MKKLGAWLIKTSHAIARWWGGLHIILNVTGIRLYLQYHLR
jgi:ribosome biogenesis SPOUT family RNA methylase Rps3